MALQKKNIINFFYSQYFADGLRMVVGILIPPLVLMQFHLFSIGMTMALGAVCISTIDSPGPVVYKRNGMLVGNLILLIIAIITGFARLNIYTLGLGIVLFSFLFTMLSVYGMRAGLIGGCGLMAMIFMMGKMIPANEVLTASATILVGGIWYLLFSLVFFGIRPYRASQQMLGENIADIANFVRTKADFYSPESDIEENYEKLVQEQIKISQSQDSIRELLYKSRRIVQKSTTQSRTLLLTFGDLTRIFDQIMATHYDYKQIRESYRDTGLLTEIKDVLHKLASCLDEIGHAMLSNSTVKQKSDVLQFLEILNKNIVSENNQNESYLVLKNILLNIEDLARQINELYAYIIPSAEFSSSGIIAMTDCLEVVSGQDYSPHIFFENLSFSSSIFKHALRVALICLIGYIAAKFFAPGHHSYWVLLTIIVILKPGFSLTKKRNYQRLLGTIAGGIIGFVILIYIPDKTLQFILLLLLMLGTYSFLRLNYVLSVILTTPCALILFELLGVGVVVKERIIDTIIGSGIAFLASYLIFPKWEYEQINNNLQAVKEANINYLKELASGFSDSIVTLAPFSLARKDLFVKSSNLSAAFERMTSEPKRKHHKIEKIHQFIILNHLLSSYLTTIDSNYFQNNHMTIESDCFASIQNSIDLLCNSDLDLKVEDKSVTTQEYAVADMKIRDAKKHNSYLKIQLTIVNKLCIVIARLFSTIYAYPL